MADQFKTVFKTDYSWLKVDQAGRARLEIAQDVDDAPAGGQWVVYRFDLDRLQEVKRDGRSYLVSERIARTYRDGQLPHPLLSYEEWFVKDLQAVADSAGTSVKQLRAAFCSANPRQRAMAYETVGGYHGFDNFDGYPLTLTDAEFNARWDRSDTGVVRGRAGKRRTALPTKRAAVAMDEQLKRIKQTMREVK